jgi:glycerophosphoryl diester phosphodiesterase
MRASTSRLSALVAGVLAAPALVLLLVPPAPAARAAAATKGAERPLVIAHRGASGYRPEHTLAAYELGARMGADYVEPDLVATKDGVLVTRHENEISTTTDVASRPEFATRRTTKTVDGVPLTGWFTEDFTLAELRTLRAKERIPALRPRNALYDGRYPIPTLQEVIDLTKRLSRELHRRIGIYPETKHPTYFRSIGLPLEERLARILRTNGLDRRNAPVFVQSFETQNLRALDRLVKVPLVQLLGAPTQHPFGDPRTYADLMTPAGLRDVATYADGLGPPKETTTLALVNDAHAAGLLVHPYTFRNENVFLPASLRRGTDPAAYGDAFSEYRWYFALGVDGVFSDNPDTAVEARAAFGP